MIVRGPDLSAATWSGGALVSSLLLALGVALWELTFGDGAVLPGAEPALAREGTPGSPDRGDRAMAEGVGLAEGVGFEPTDP